VNVGVIKEVDEPRERPTYLQLRWDRDQTRALFANPVPAGEIRKSVRPIVTVHNLTVHPRLVARLLRHAGVTTGKKGK
jgi:hypothetical protein